MSPFYMPDETRSTCRYYYTVNGCPNCPVKNKCDKYKWIPVESDDEAPPVYILKDDK